MNNAFNGIQDDIFLKDVFPGRKSSEVIPPIEQF